jgi:ribokinase
MALGRIPKVVVIGPIYVDMAIRCGKIPSPVQSAIGSSLSYTLTGPGPNQAVEAAFCGCEVCLISKIGGDPFGQMAKTSLAEHKVNTDHILTAETNSALCPRDIEAAEQVISEADVCVIHGGLPQDAIIAAVRSAKIHSKKVILNPAKPAEQKEQESCDLPTEYFMADIMIPNLDEAADITEQPTSGIRTAKLIGSDLVARGVKYAVITMGKRGCMVVDRDSADQIPAFDVELVDQTGRGDAFTGALAAYCAVEDDVRGAVKFASAAGALACTKFGSIESMPTKADIIQLLQKEDIE